MRGFGDRGLGSFGDGGGHERGLLVLDCLLGLQHRDQFRVLVRLDVGKGIADGDLGPLGFDAGGFGGLRGFGASGLGLGFLDPGCFRASGLGLGGQILGDFGLGGGIPGRLSLFFGDAVGLGLGGEVLGDGLCGCQQRGFCPGDIDRRGLDRGGFGGFGLCGGLGGFGLCGSLGGFGLRGSLDRKSVV